ncbi:MAG: phosphotransferase [Candidatus Viridilinea halotolerans]|uniref:Phosphotransferase n=1 Tax=Candidatus Viridilinea halotolerans TaxID=2491704 RepID=A0A426TV10_9CHLR|nr:MAG: phosphotransferase [Candidatus Viridilinea halotolerans]
MTYPFCYPGALHIHTRYSDGTGTYPDVIAAAQAAGLRWIIVTDHDTLAGAPFAGWHNDLLVIVGHEITPDHNHFLALNVDTVVSRDLPPQAFIDEVYARGGFGIIAHPDEQVTNTVKEIYRWDDWAIDGPRQRAGQTVGLEIWNWMSDWTEHLTPRNRYLNFFVPALGLSGPTPATLAWWDRLNMSGRRTFGVGGVDAHAFKHPVPWGEVEVFSYRWLFGTLTNYLLLHEPLSRDDATATQQVYAALAQGRSYFVNRHDGRAAPLAFSATCANACYAIGDTASLRDGPLLLEVDVGLNAAQVQLIANGQLLSSGRRRLRQTINAPGVYRIEAHIGGKPWLFGNPLYVGM